MEPTIKQLRILNSVLCGIALLATIIRLWIRYSRRKLWWDDFWVVLAALCTIILMAANFLHTADPTTIPQNAKIAIYYLCIQFYYAVTWTSRLSILFTVIRISFEKLHRLLIISAWLFGLSWVVLTAQIFWVCEPEPDWKQQPIPQCVLGDDVAIAQVITFIITDAILVFAPVRLIWGARLAPITKIRLIAVFTATIITTAVSLYYIYAMLRIGGLTEEFAATIHDGVSLLVANLSVVLSFLFKLGSTATSQDTPGNEFQAVRRTPARSFGFLSALTTHGQVSEPTHVHLHVEQVDDRSLADYEDGTRKGPMISKTFVGSDSLEMKAMDAKAQF